MAKLSRKKARALVAAGLAAPVRAGRKREKTRADWQRATQGELLAFRLQWAHARDSPSPNLEIRDDPLHERHREFGALPELER
jgi:hypothetical protein